MDRRGREAKKRYRSNEDERYKTTSLTLEKKVIDFIEKKVNKTEDKNMSRFIEENVSGHKIIEMPKRRKFKSFPIKKTFTFTEKFVEKIKKSGNISLFIEKILKKKFKIK